MIFVALFFGSARSLPESTELLKLHEKFVINMCGLRLKDMKGLDPDGTEFLLVFNQGSFSEDGTMLLSEWLAHTPPEVLTKNFGLDRSALAKLPTDALYISALGQHCRQTS